MMLLGQPARIQYNSLYMELLFGKCKMLGDEPTDLQATVSRIQFSKECASTIEGFPSLERSSSSQKHVSQLQDTRQTFGLSQNICCALQTSRIMMKLTGCENEIECEDEQPSFSRNIFRQPQANTHNIRTITEARWKEIPLIMHKLQVRPI